MVKPPFVMFASIAVSPLCRCHGPHLPFEIGEVLEPVITFTEHRARVIPVIIPLAVWREVNISYGGSTRPRIFIADEALPPILLALQVLERFFQNGLGAV